MLHGGVLGAAVGINDDGGGSCKDGLVLWPPAGGDDGFDGEAAFVQLVCKEHAACLVLMLSFAVAGFSGDEDNFLLRSLLRFASLLIRECDDRENQA